jgi:hypothetical protein
LAVTLSLTSLSTPLSASAAGDESDTPASATEEALAGPAAPLVAEPVEANATADDAAVTDGTISVTVPRDPSNGVQLVLDSGTISVQLPSGEDASNAVELDSGAITYPSDTGVANTVIPLDDGAQLLTTISSPNAPTSFSYDFGVSDDGTAAVTDDGSALVLASSGEVLLRAAAPWAVDANGVSVPTHYEVRDTELIQVVDHTSGEFAYPIVADPRLDSGIGWTSLLFNRHETATIASAGLVGLGGFTAACGVGGPVAIAACSLAAAALGATAVYANDNGQCVGLSFWGVAPYAGWNPFLHNGADCN